MAIQATPYEVVFGQSPPIHLSYDLPRESKAKIVAKCVKDREDMLFILKVLSINGTSYNETNCT